MTYCLFVLAGLAVLFLALCAVLNFHDMFLTCRWERTYGIFFFVAMRPASVAGCSASGAVDSGCTCNASMGATTAAHAAAAARSSASSELRGSATRRHQLWLRRRRGRALDAPNSGIRNATTSASVEAAAWLSIGCSEQRSGHGHACAGADPHESQGRSFRSLA